MITSQELAFVRLAMRQRLLSVNVVQEAVERKKWDAPDRPITEILVDMGVLGPDQATRLKRQLEGAAPPKEAPRMRATQVGKDPAAREDPDGPLAGLPSRIGPYQLVRMLGAGAMGAVYHARHVELERDVALKLLQSEGAPTARAIQRFKREARLAARLDHPNIVRVYEAGHEAGQHFIAMDMVRGRSVGELLTLGEVTVRRAVHVMRKTAEAVAYAHEQGVIHRDLKPANILVDDRSGEPRVTDFGLATLSEPDEDDKLTRTGAAVGTPAYMAPEQVRGRVDEIDRRTDVYALGATLYEMLTGAPPFDAATFLELAKRICDEDPVAPRKKNPAVPAPVETVCLKALEKDPAARYQSAADMAADLAAFLDDAPIRAQPLRARRAGAPLARPALVAGALGFAAVVGAGLGFFLSPGDPRAPDRAGRRGGAPRRPRAARRARPDAAHAARGSPAPRGPGRGAPPALPPARLLDQAVGVDRARGPRRHAQLSGTFTRGLLRTIRQPGGTVAVFTPTGARPAARGHRRSRSSLEAGPTARRRRPAGGSWPRAPLPSAAVTVLSGGVEEKVPVPVARRPAHRRRPENVTALGPRRQLARRRRAPGRATRPAVGCMLPQRLRVTVPPGGRRAARHPPRSVRRRSTGACSGPAGARRRW
ncbi:MAG: serine/threonine protein kinase [Planctomycetota bacterium]|nr:serine/threonine protein kinase [Planctomycetota bacterium]